VNAVHAFFRFLTILAGALALAIVAGVAAGALIEARVERARFLEECESFRPRYECVAMWRVGGNL